MAIRGVKKGIEENDTLALISWLFKRERQHRHLILLEAKSGLWPY